MKHIIQSLGGLIQALNAVVRRYIRFTPIRFSIAVVCVLGVVVLTRYNADYLNSMKPGSTGALATALSFFFSFVLLGLYVVAIHDVARKRYVAMRFRELTGLKIPAKLDYGERRCVQPVVDRILSEKAVTANVAFVQQEAELKIARAGGPPLEAGDSSQVAGDNLIRYRVHVSSLKQWNESASTHKKDFWETREFFGMIGFLVREKLGDYISDTVKETLVIAAAVSIEMNGTANAR